MAKKQQQHLQAELNSDEDLLAFLEKPGVILMDVYSEWCGPCIAMLANLKKIKMELGGDDLHLALVKSDTVDLLQRFRKKSEPTWLFASNGKLVNIAFGCNVPHLMGMITSELELEKKYVAGEVNRKFYDLTELLPIEQARYDAKKALEDAKATREQEEREKKRLDYLTFVCKEIVEHANDMGVTVFMPHVITKDLFKLLEEIGEKCRLTAKEKATITITENDLNVINFDCANPMSEQVVEHIKDEQLLAVCWKLPETELRPTEDVIAILVDLLTEPQSITPGQIPEEGEEELKYPPVLNALELDIVPIDGGFVGEHDGEQEEENDEMSGDSTRLDESMNIDIIETPPDSSKSSDESPTKQREIEESELTPTDEFEDDPSESHGPDGSSKEEKYEENATVSIADESQEPSLQQPVKKRASQILVIPPLWTPKNRNANAILIYLYFHGLIDHFLPPDPVPDPPHCVISFDAFKRRDVLEICEQYANDILAYGYFTTDDPDTAVIIAASTLAYTSQKPNLDDKLVIKVSILKENALFALSNLAPSNVSANAEEGEIDGLKYFPETFVQGSEIPEEVEEGEVDEGEELNEVKVKIEGVENDTQDTEVDRDDQRVEVGEPINEKVVPKEEN